MIESGQKFPCPCCGYRVFRLPPGSHGVCPICGWEDDLAQLRFPRMAGSANRASLLQAQQNYETGGSAERTPRQPLRTACSGEYLEAQWRRLDSGRDYMEEPCRGQRYADSYPEDTTLLYYWRSTFWHPLLV